MSVLIQKYSKYLNKLKMCLQLLSKTLATIDDDKWVCQLGAEATRYLSTYNNDLEEKVSAFNKLVHQQIKSEMIALV